MPGREVDKARYPTVEFLLHAVAGWINKHRVMDGVRDELGQAAQKKQGRWRRIWASRLEIFAAGQQKEPVQRTRCRKC